MDTFTNETLWLLSATFHELNESEIARAVTLAAMTGAEAVESARERLKDFEQRYPAEPEEYFLIVIRAASRAGVIGPAEVAEWRAASAGPAEAAIMDPRVQAFCAAWTQRASLYRATNFEERLRTLARCLEIRTAAVRLSRIAGLGVPVFSAPDGLYLVLTDEEADRLRSDWMHTEVKVGAAQEGPEPETDWRVGLEPRESGHVHFSSNVRWPARIRRFGDYQIFAMEGAAPPEAMGIA